MAYSQEDATDIEISIPYQWRDWYCVRSSECLYLWNEFIVLELSVVSNGWFRYLMDGKVGTMYSSGSSETGSSDPFNGRSDFIEKMQHSCSQIPNGLPSHPFLSYPSSVKLVIGNWSIHSENEGELIIHNVDGSQVMLPSYTLLRSNNCISKQHI